MREKQHPPTARQHTRNSLARTYGVIGLPAHAALDTLGLAKHSAPHAHFTVISVALRLTWWNARRLSRLRTPAYLLLPRGRLHLPSLLYLPHVTTRALALTCAAEPLTATRVTLPRTRKTNAGTQRATAARRCGTCRLTSWQDPRTYQPSVAGMDSSDFHPGRSFSDAALLLRGWLRSICRRHA